MAIVELKGDDAVVEVGGVRRRANVSFIPDAAVGDYVLVHAGFAIQKWSEEDVREYNEIVGQPAAATKERSLAETQRTQKKRGRTKMGHQGAEESGRRESAP